VGNYFRVLLLKPGGPGVLSTSMPPESPSERLSRLYTEYGNLVFRRAKKLLRDDAGAADVCHEVFLILMKTELDDVNMVGWFYRVTTNQCLNVLRDEQRHRRLLASVPESSHNASLPLPLLLRGIPEDMQALVILYHVDELSQQEIAEILCVSQRTVSARLLELKKRLSSTWQAPTRKVASDE
jgi:RNA polymerase sigma factor (sigma-70 family)